MLNATKNGVIRIPGGRRKEALVEPEETEQPIEDEILVWEPRSLVVKKPEKPKPKPIPAPWESNIQHSISGRGRRKRKK